MRLAAVGLLAAAVSPVPGVGAHGAGGPLGDGNWSGALSVGVRFDVDGGTLVAQGAGNGTLTMSIAGGAATGEYTLAGSSSANLQTELAAGQAHALATIGGSIEGTATGPILQPESAHADVTGSVSVNGFDVPINESLDVEPEDLLSSTLIITSSSCTYSSGTWAQEIPNAIEGGGADLTSFEGSWAAVHESTSPDTTAATDAADAIAASAALQDILDRGETMLTAWVATGTFAAEALETVLVDAEHVASRAAKIGACSGTTAEWSSPLGGLVQRILLAIADAPSTSAQILRFGVATGVRTGTLPSIDNGLEARLEAKARDILRIAIAAGSTTDIALVGITADSMAWTDLAAEAADASGGGK